MFYEATRRKPRRGVAGNCSDCSGEGRRKRKGVKRFVGGTGSHCYRRLGGYLVCFSFLLRMIPGNWKAFGMWFGMCEVCRPM